MSQPKSADAKALELVRKCEAEGRVVRRIKLKGSAK